MNSRSAGIDTLRGGFTFWVVFAHAIPWAFIVYGDGASPSWLRALNQASLRLFQPHGETNPAVLAFIVLSGYCIYKSWLRNDSVSAYFVRRAFRILPIFAVGMAVGITAFNRAIELSPQAAMFSGTTGIDVGCVIAKATVLAAFTPQFHPCTYLGNAPLLTVMVEIALYLLFPLALLFGRRATLFVCVACLVAGVISAAFNTKYANFYNWWQNSSVFGYLPYWWIGALFASSEKLPLRGLHLFGAWLALTALCWIDPTGIASEIRKLPFAALIGMAVLRTDHMKLRASFGSFLGHAGYSIYALHAPILYLMLLSGFGMWTCVATITVVGIISYFAIERPLDKMGHTLARRDTNL